METTPWPLRNLTFKTLDLSSLAAFYEELGFRLAGQSDDGAVFTDGEGFRLTLRLLANGRPRPPKQRGSSTSRCSCQTGRPWAHLCDSLRESPFASSARPTILSASLMELKCMRTARDQCEWEADTVKMATIALNLDDLASLPGPEWRGFLAGTRLGHLHLTVGNLDRSVEFYKTLGLKMTLDWGTFKFLSWNGYHHHVALTLVEGRGAAPRRTGIVFHRTPFPCAGSAGSQWDSAPSGGALDLHFRYSRITPGRRRPPGSS